MPQTSRWPFQRVLVDHLFHGTTRVWWKLAADFSASQPHVFQLQAGYTGNNNALDWVDIGTPATNTYFADDDTHRERAGKQLLTHYRVILTAAGKKYVSGPQGIWGLLNTKDWNLSKEIIRKERLRLGLVSSNGYLLRKMRYGVTNPGNTDTLTGEVVDSGDLSSWGTAFKVGYHPPVPLPVDFLQRQIVEFRGGDSIAKHSSQPDTFEGRVVAFPGIAKEDVWVDATTDQRWIIHDIKIDASLRNVPLIFTAQFRKAPHNDVIYKIPVESRSYDPKDLDEEYQPTTGDGSVRVDHDYTGEDAYRYLEDSCCPISGATVLAFTEEDWDGGAREAQYAIATSQTDEQGGWLWAMMLDPGNYMLQFEKPGQYGPDTSPLVVTEPEAPAAPPPLKDLIGTEEEDESFSDDFGDF